MNLATVALPLLESIAPDLNTIIQNAIYSFGVPAPAQKCRVNFLSAPLNGDDERKGRS